MELCTFCDMRAKELAEYKRGKELALNKLYANVGRPSEFKEALIGGERSGIDPQECREFVLAKLEKEISRR